MGRRCALDGIAESADLRAGLDFRLATYRREVFHRFYEFHLRYRAHPGAVYYLIPFLRTHYGWDDETAYWWAFLNGNTQHPITSTILLHAFPSADSNPDDVRSFLDTYWRELEFDADRRYWKVKLPDAIRSYQTALAGRSQVAYFTEMIGSSERESFDGIWRAVRSSFLGFGRLSAWSYLEYLRIVGLAVAPSTLMLDDRDGSKSHRNGLCKVLGRDDLDWHNSNPDFDGRYAPDVVAWLSEEGETLLGEAVDRAAGCAHQRDVTYFTLESTLCCYKSWHRPNRRYPNVYNDMLHDRIRRSERAWGARVPIDLEVFWRARLDALPSHLRLEDSPGDPGLAPEKQNHYRETGEVIMMDRDWPCFQNAFNDRGRDGFTLR